MSTAEPVPVPVYGADAATRCACECVCADTSTREIWCPTLYTWRAERNWQATGRRRGWQVGGGRAQSRQEAVSIAGLAARGRGTRASGTSTTLRRAGSSSSRRSRSGSRGDSARVSRRDRCVREEAQGMQVGINNGQPQRLLGVGEVDGAVGKASSTSDGVIIMAWGGGDE